jgi:two-component system invasion response regulator UvrY
MKSKVCIVDDHAVVRKGLKSSRELEFLRLICDEEEFTYEQIAEIMGVHVRTVDSFRKSLFQKLQKRSKSGLVLYAIKNGLLNQ